MRRRSGRKCIEMAKWVEPARLGTELARLSTERRVDNIIMSLDILQTILAGDVQEEQRNSVVAPIIQERRCIQHCGY